MFYTKAIRTCTGRLKMCLNIFQIALKIICIYEKIRDKNLHFKPYLSFVSYDNYLYINLSS